MKSKRLWLLLSLVFALAAFFWWRRDHDGLVNLPPGATGPWVAFGDSLTEGFGVGEGQDYPAQLSRRLGIPIRNLGVSGHTTDDGLKRLEEIAALEPRVVLLCLGGNDVLQRTSSTEMIAHLGRIIDRFQAQGSFVVLLGVRSASLRDRNEKLFRRLAREKRVLYVPNILRGIWARPIYMSDALHPNEQGYAIIAERVAQALRPWLEQLKPVAPEREG